MARARTFEGPALVLGDVLHAQGHRDLAAALREVLPETDAVRDDVQRARVAERLRRVAAAEHVPSELRARAALLADLAAPEPMARRGRAGTVWIAWSGDIGDDGGEDAGDDTSDAGYSASWQGDRADDDWCEDGPEFTDLREALAWARQRADAVVVRPEWDQDRYYWAGEGPDRRGFPPLDEFRA